MRHPSQSLRLWLAGCVNCCSFDRRVTAPSATAVARLPLLAAIRSPIHVGILVLLAAATVGCDEIRTWTVGTRLRCASGLVALGARCCAVGQTLRRGHCVGEPDRCPESWLKSTGGCVRRAFTVHVPAGRYTVGPNDWESEHVSAASGQVPEFWIDGIEVTHARWHACIDSGACTATPNGVEFSRVEPGLPVTEISAEEAATFCAAQHGRLPRSSEWLRVTAGDTSRRFPWGQTGLVCRRASYGLVGGPCAEDGASPDWAGSRPDGKSELGILDLVGNVSEITESDQGSWEARGGSFHADHAAELKSWASLPYRGPAADIGFRCAYDHDPEMNDSP